MKILVTGGSGCVGFALCEIINPEHTWIFMSSKDCNLCNREETLHFFDIIKPDYIVHLAAHVTGMYKNMKDRTTGFTNNVRINENVLEAANKCGVQRGIFCLSVGMFPDNPSHYPIDETMIFDGKPHSSIEGYAYSKRMLAMQCNNYNLQYNREYICVIPSNLYGSNDRFNLETAHIIPGLIHKFYLAKKNNTDITIWGSGAPLKQFLYSYDLANIIIYLLFNYKDTKPIICAGDEISVRTLVDKIAIIMDYKGKIIYDTTKNDGCLKRTADTTYLKKIYPVTFTPLDIGLKLTIHWFIENYDNLKR